MKLLGNGAFGPIGFLVVGNPLEGQENPGPLERDEVVRREHHLETQYVLVEIGQRSRIVAIDRHRT